MSSYMNFNTFVKHGGCPLLVSGFTSPWQKVVPPDIYYACFDIYIQLSGSGEFKRFRFANDGNRFTEGTVVETEKAPNDIPKKSLETLWKPMPNNVRPGRIIGFYDFVLTKRILNASTQGTQYLLDLRSLEK